MATKTLIVEEAVKRWREQVHTNWKGPQPNPYELEFACARMLPFGHRLKGEFVLNMSQMQWDFLYLEKDGIKNHWFRRIILRGCMEKRVFAAGSASSGKTFGFCCLGYNLWKLNPWNSTFLITSTSFDALKDRAWGTLLDLFEKDKFQIGTRVNDENAIIFESKAKQRDARDAIKAIALPKGSEGEKAIGKIQGRKNEHIYWLAQPLDSKILTPTGWTTFGEIQEGDRIISSSGGTQIVSKTHPVKKESIYELTFSDGSKARSSKDHLWTMITKRGKRHTAPLEFFNNTIKQSHTDNKGRPVYRWSLPPSPVVQYHQKHPLQLSPYTLGALLGDGSILTGAALYCFNKDLEIAERVKSELPENHQLVFYRERHSCHQLQIIGKDRKNAVVSELRRLQLLGKHGDYKFIPKEYLYSSVESRIALLQGLMDTDGSVTDSTLRYSTNSPQLSKDVMELIRSLGGYADECVGVRPLGIRYTVVASLPSLGGVIPFHCSRKRNRCKGYSRSTGRHRRLVSVEEVGFDDVRCITVSGEDGLYITDDFVITHNCDEYAHMDPFVQEARKNLAANPLFVFWACSNKPEEGDPMYQDAVPHPDKYPLGWADPEIPTKIEWEVRGGICLYFDGEKSPNLKADPSKPPPFPRLTTRKYIDEIIEEEGGTDGSGYWRYVKAFPIAGESHDKVLTPKVLERFRALEEPVWSGEGWITVAGLDAAWTKGGDDCMADFGRLGMDTEGKKILAHERDAVKLNTKVTAKGTVEEQVAEAFIAECKKNNRNCHIVAIDISGGGGRVANAVRNEADKQGWRLELIPVDSAGSADDSEVYQVGDKRKTGKELFDRRVSELNYGYRLDVEKGLIRGCDLQSRAIRELCDRRVMNDERKRWQLERKDDYKKRHNGKSCDASDARVLCRFAARKNGLGAVTTPRSIPNPFAEEKPRQQAYTTQPSRKARYCY
jgi:hypothetical protein